MSDLAKAGVDHVIEVADAATGAAIHSVEATLAEAGKFGAGTILVGTERAGAFLEHVNTLREAYLADLRKVADAVTEAIPGP